MDFDHNKEHKFLPLTQAAENKRKDLKENSEVLERTVADGNRKTQVLKEDNNLLKLNYDKAKCVINERKEQFFKRFQEALEKKTGSVMEEARQVFDRKTKQVEDKINETEAFVNGMKASANMAHSLLENGNDEEIVRSFQSVQNNLNNAKKEILEKTSNDVCVLPWNSNDIDKMLLAEIKDSFQLKENMDNVTDKNKLYGYPKLDDDDVKSIRSLVTKPSFKVSKTIERNYGNEMQIDDFLTKPRTRNRHCGGRNHHTGAAGYSNLQRPRHTADYTSGQGHGRGNMSHQSHAAQRSNQVQAKDRWNAIPVGELNGDRYF